MEDIHWSGKVSTDLNLKKMVENNAKPMGIWYVTPETERW